MSKVEQQGSVLLRAIWSFRGACIVAMSRCLYVEIAASVAGGRTAPSGSSARE